MPSSSNTTLALRRQFTRTPLARKHGRVRDGKPPRAVRSIPFESFDRTKYPEPALALAVEAMTGLACGEYSALDAFSRVTVALARQAAPFDLVSAATEIPSDEMRHAELALRAASAYGGAEVGGAFDTALFDQPRSDGTSMEDLDQLMLQLPTISETIAAALLDACREQATDPVARAVFDAIIADEVHHLRLGWYYLAWREPQWSRAERQRAADVAAHSIVHVERQFWTGRDAPPGSRRASAALGILGSKKLREVIRHVMEHELIPGLDALGLGASHAWKVRLRGKA